MHYSTATHYHLEGYTGIVLTEIQNYRNSMYPNSPETTVIHRITGIHEFLFTRENSPYLL